MHTPRSTIHRRRATLAGLAVAAAAGGGALAASASSAHAGHDHASTAGAAKAMTADTNAPAGAPGHWLPNDPWVMEHWLPFDAQRLLDLLHVDVKTVRQWLKTPGHTLAQLGAAHGYADKEKLLGDLLAPRQAGVDAATFRTLQDRTEQVLTQSHLAQHVLGHLFHDPQIPQHAQTIFGVSTKELRAYRKQGLTAAQIGAKGHRTPDQVKAAVMATLSASQADGVKRGATTQAQADAMLAAQRKALPKWLDRKPKDKGMGTGGG
jgi:hypothetical protein